MRAAVPPQVRGATLRALEQVGSFLRISFIFTRRHLHDLDRRQGRGRSERDHSNIIVAILFIGEIDDDRPWIGSLPDADAPKRIPL